MNKHLKAIESGFVTKTNVIGLRKALAAEERRAKGYSVSSTAPKLAGPELRETMAALHMRQPRVVGELHESGKRLLQSRRYARRLECRKSVIDTIQAFELVRFDDTGRTIVPVYRCIGAKDSFLFRNVPWQSGGDGPEILP